MKIRYILLFAVISALCWRCSETKEISPEELGTNYFPLKTGTYSIYQVDGAIKINDDDSVGFSYLLKESVVDSFQNLESGISYKIERQKKFHENDPWVTDSIWTARIDDHTAVRTEHNVPIASLTFPLRENKSWDGNKLNSKYKKEFEMINIGQPYIGSFGTYEATVTVIQEYLPDFFDKNISAKEIYSKYEGLVYKENIILDYKQDGDYGLEKIETSLVYFQHLIEYGQE